MKGGKVAKAGRGGKGGKAGAKGAAASRQKQLVSQLEHELTAPGQEHPAVVMEPATTGELV